MAGEMVRSYFWGFGTAVALMAAEFLSWQGSFALAAAFAVGAAVLTVGFFFRVRAKEARP